MDRTRLLEELKEGVRPAAEMWELSKRAGFKEQTVKDARKHLRIKPYQNEGVGKRKWFWGLPK
ncbi:MAG: hypothetical protein EXS05_15490 [Planctomycetaceae bacterium]|nr:hypothetical protein [Planctomycetaceae bacterium]